MRIGFYLWLSLLNLLATSTLWARAADAFDSSAAARLFGFLGAGATLGTVTLLPGRLLVVLSSAHVCLFLVTLLCMSGHVGIR